MNDIQKQAYSNVFSVRKTGPPKIDCAPASTLEVVKCLVAMFVTVVSAGKFPVFSRTAKGAKPLMVFKHFSNTCSIDAQSFTFMTKDS